MTTRRRDAPTVVPGATDAGAVGTSGYSSRVSRPGRCNSVANASGEKRSPTTTSQCAKDRRSSATLFLACRCSCGCCRTSTSVRWVVAFVSAHKHVTCGRRQLAQTTRQGVDVPFTLACSHAGSFHRARRVGVGHRSCRRGENADSPPIDGRGKTRGYSGRFFCPRCGSPVFGRTADEVEANLGSPDAPDQLTPTYESWTVRRESWLPPFPLTRRYDHDRDASSRFEKQACKSPCGSTLPHGFHTIGRRLGRGWTSRCC